ncbi:DUF779 domain-containing protein [Arthrobacter sp. JSM 101049]|uniref:DUF779 domain-containing protein n=1 Tax=unclassified Arthrobacter TaxID=235627 RepID=UPI003567FF7D
MDTVLDARPTIEGEDFTRVRLSADAQALLRTLWARHGPLMFHQSGGCCDGSSPMCFPDGDFITAEADIRLGVFDLTDDDGAPLGELDFWMSREQFEYWKHTRLTVDVVSGRGSGFSVEAPEGKRFLIRSELIGA